MYTKELKQFRAETGISMMACNDAIKKANGDVEKAKIILKEWGQKIAEGRKTKPTSAGVVYANVYDNNIGVMREVNCETDFVAKSPQFQEFVESLCSSLAYMVPIPETVEAFCVFPGVALYLAEQRFKFGENISIRRFVRYEI